MLPWVQRVYGVSQLCAARVAGSCAAAAAAAAPPLQSLSLCRRPPPTLAPSPAACLVRWATSKAGGSTKNGRDSQPKYLGVKRYGGHAVAPGDIIIRQRGQKYGIVESTDSVGMGRDFTIYATKPGYVKFWFHAMRKKYFVEVVCSPPGEEPVVKYPICRLKAWQVPNLLKLPADTPIAPNVRKQLLDHLASVPAAQLGSLAPRGCALIGGIEQELYGALFTAAPAAAAAAPPTPAAPVA